MYAIIEADGFFGDVATVHEVYVEHGKAVKSVQHDRRWQVIGRPDREFAIGQKIHRNDIGHIYPRVSKAQPADQ